MSKNELPNFGQQYIVTGAVGPLEELLVANAIDYREYQRRREALPLWKKVWYYGAEPFFWASVALALFVGLVTR